jgi:hypothetical protein
MITMKLFIRSLIHHFMSVAMKCLLVLFFFAATDSFAQSLTTEFSSAGYTLTDLGSIGQLPSQYGGLTIRPEQPNTLYIGGNANYGAGALYTVALVRDTATQHITGFGGDAVLYRETPNIDGGVFFAPNGTLLFTRYSMNELGQVLPDNSYVSTPLTPYGVSSSVGSLAIVPAGYPGAGGLVFSSYNPSIIYNVPYTIDETGQYMLSNQVAETSVYETATGPEGIAYIPSGSAAFPNLSMAVSSYSRGAVVVFEVGPDGLPVITTARDMVVALSGAEGALIDPVTGDFLFSTFGGGDKIIRITGFEAPSAIENKSQSTYTRFDVFPNPTKGLVKLGFYDPVFEVRVEIRTLLGESMLIQECPGSNLYELDLSSLPVGLYFIHVQNGTMTGVRPFIKQ